MNEHVRPNSAYLGVVGVVLDKAIEDGSVNTLSTFANVRTICRIDADVSNLDIFGLLSQKGGFLAEDVAKNSADVFDGYRWVLNKNGSWTLYDDEWDPSFTLPAHPVEARSAIMGAYKIGHTEGEQRGESSAKQEIRRALGLQAGREGISMITKNKIESLEQSAALDPTYEPAMVAASCRDAALEVHFEARRYVADAVRTGDVNKRAAYSESCMRAKAEADEWQAVVEHFTPSAPRQ